MQELLGHSDIQTTARYLHSDTRTKQSAVGKLNGLLGSPPEPAAAPGSDQPEHTLLGAVEGSTPAA